MGQESDKSTKLCCPVSATSETTLAQLVEKEFLALADILIMLGYGGFQHSLLLRFKSKGNDRNHWYKLCSDSARNDHLPLSIS